MAAYEQTITVKVKIEPADETSNRFFQLLDQLPTVLKAIDPSMAYQYSTADSWFNAKPGAVDDPWRSFRNTDTTGDTE